MATLVSHYKFENGYTDTIGNNGLAAGGTGNSFSNTIFKVDAYSLSLNGSGYAEDTSVTALDPGNADRSVACWFRVAGFGVYLLGLGTGDSYKQFVAVLNGANDVRLQLWASDVNLTSIPTTLTTNTWFHFIWTYTAANKTSELFINNASQGSGAHGTASNLTFGKIRVGGQVYDANGLVTGYIDDFRIYNGVLSSAERTTIYDLGNARANSNWRSLLGVGLKKRDSGLYVPNYY